MNTDRSLNGTLGEKVGMSHIFVEDGSCVPVTVVKVTPSTVIQVKDKKTDGYSAIQLAIKPKKQQRVNKPLSGHFAKAGKGAFYELKELRISDSVESLPAIGDQIPVSDVFVEGQFVDVTAKSLGRGFSGVVRRHHIKGQPSTRGTHEYRRHVGSVGCRKTPGRIHKNKRMPGRMGGSTVTVQNLKIMRILAEEGILLIKGCIPGPRGNLVSLKQAVKR